MEHYEHWIDLLLHCDGHSQLILTGNTIAKEMAQDMPSINTIINMMVKYARHDSFDSQYENPFLKLYCKKRLLDCKTTEELHTTAKEIAVEMGKDLPTQNTALVVMAAYTNHRHYDKKANHLLDIAQRAGLKCLH